MADNGFENDGLNDACIADPSVSTEDISRDFFSENGKISRISSISFEYRKSQEDMARLVSDALFNGKHVVIEAPTGVGKSFAYLVPALYYSKMTGCKVVIATDTNTLLDQLETKDASAISGLLSAVNPELFSSGVKIVSIRGKANYLCLKRLDDFFQSGGGSKNLSKKDLDAVSKALNDFRMRSKYGAKSEISRPSRLINEIWPEVCMSDSQSCSTEACGRKQSDCKYYASLVRAVASADIVLTNHSLVLSDIQLRNQDEKVIGEDAWKKEFYVLPPFENLIIDEAHNISRNCESALSGRFSFNEIKRHLQAMMRKSDNVFARLCEASPNDFTSDQLSEVMEKADRLQKDFNNFNSSFALSIEDDFAKSLRERRDEIDLSAGFFTEDCRHAAEAYVASLRDLLKSFNPKPSKNNEDEIFQARMIMNDVSSQSDVVSIILEGRMTDSDPPIPYACVATVRRDSSKGYAFSDMMLHSDDAMIEISAVPIFAGKALGSLLYSRMKGLVFTSATLNANDRFRYFRNFSGLDKDESVGCFSLDPVFDYAHNMVEIAVEGLDTSKDGDSEEMRKAAVFIAEAINIANGRTLCLFSSYAALRNLGEYITENKLLNDDLELLMQSRGAFSKDLMRKFRENEKTSLFATSSFWEGVDFPGDTLQLLIIHKIPFRVPSVLGKQQGEFLKKSGGRAFMSIDIPSSVIRMRQGIGRLLRTKKDKGVAILLDTRLTDGKPYGRMILNALYMGNTVTADMEHSLSLIRDFFADGEPAPDGESAEKGA